MCLDVNLISNAHLPVSHLPLKTIQYLPDIVKSTVVKKHNLKLK